MISLRTYLPEDRATIQSLIIELQDYEATLSKDRAPGNEIADKYLQELISDVTQNNGQIILAVDGETVFGCIAYYPEKDTLNFDPHLYISDLIVSAAYRGSGVGKLLMQNAEKYARDTGLATVRVGVLVTSPSKIFYEKCGYQPESLMLLKKVAN